MIKRIFLAVLALVALLVLAVAINTWRQGSRQIDVPPLAPIAVDEKGAAESLSAAIRARTVSSRDDPALNADQFEALHAHLQSRYPKLHATLTREVVGGLSLLYTWKGSDPTAQPIALMAHQDVVPIAPGTEKDWQAEPFAGTIRDGFVWGRGAWDLDFERHFTLARGQRECGVGVAVGQSIRAGLLRDGGQGRLARAETVGVE